VKNKDKRIQELERKLKLNNNQTLDFCKTSETNILIIQKVKSR